MDPATILMTSFPAIIDKGGDIGAAGLGILASKQAAKEAEAKAAQQKQMLLYGSLALGIVVIGIIAFVILKNK